MRSMRILLLVFATLFCHLGASADECIIDGIYYELDYDNTARVKAHPDGYSGDIKVPNYVTYEGDTYAVVEIGYDAFRGSSDLISVALPYCVTGIASEMFAGCTGLKSVNFANDIKSIESNAFYGCKSLESFTIPASVVQIGAEAFAECSSLISLTFENSEIPMESICSFASIPIKNLYIGRNIDGWYLWNTSTLETVEISGSATCINSNFFENCSQLSSVTIGENVETIETYAFNNCTALQRVTIPAKVKIIGNDAFVGCASLTSVIFEEGVTTVGLRMFTDCSSLTDVHLPSTMQTISDYAFSGCPLSSELIIPEQVDSIGSGAFSGCKNIQTVQLPKQLMKLCDAVFERCSALTNVVLSDNVESIGEGTFALCKALKSVTLGKNVQSISGRAFQECTKLESVNYAGTLSDWLKIKFVGGVETYPEDTNPLSYAKQFFTEFGTENQALVSDVVIPEDIPNINDYAFNNYKGLTSVVIPVHVDTVGVSAFEGRSNMTKEEIHANYIKESAFYANRQVKEIILGEELAQVELEAFSVFAHTNVRYEGTIDKWCNIYFHSKSSNPFMRYGLLYIAGEKLEGDISLPPTAYSIGQYAFNNCSSITSVILHQNTRKVHDNAFSGCEKLKVLEQKRTTRAAGSDVAEEGLEIGDNAFASCTELAEINLEMGVKYIGNEAFGGTAWDAAQPDGMVYLLDFAYKYKGEMAENTTIELKEGTSGLAGGIFSGQANMVGVKLPKSLKSIGSNAFANTAITSIVIPENVDTIGAYAFYRCGLMTDIVLPSALKTMSYFMLAECSALKSLSIPANVTYLDAYTLYNCNMLEEISCYSTVPPVCATMTYNGIIYPASFPGVSQYNCKLRVPKGTTEVYTAALGWNNFSQIEEFDATAIDKVTYGQSVAGKVLRYDLSGKAVSNDIKGIQIIRDASGKTRKIVVK